MKFKRAIVAAGILALSTSLLQASGEDDLDDYEFCMPADFSLDLLAEGEEEGEGNEEEGEFEIEPEEFSIDNDDLEDEFGYQIYICIEDLQDFIDGEDTDIDLVIADGDTIIECFELDIDDAEVIEAKEEYDNEKGKSSFEATIIALVEIDFEFGDIEIDLVGLFEIELEEKIKDDERSISVEISGEVKGAGEIDDGDEIDVVVEDGEIEADGEVEINIDF